MAENSQAVIPDNLIIVDGEIGVPSSSPSDAGKVLTVDSDGSPEWVIPSGGTQYTEGNGIDISEENVISVDTTVVATQTDLGNVRQVPSSTSADEDKVLTVNSSGVPEWADASTELPTVTGNAGKILTVNSGATGVEWADAPTELPSISGNGSKVLKVNAGATAVEWAAESTELPTVTSADNGKVLGVTDTSGSLSWVSQTPAQVNADWNAVSGAAQILNKPNIPTVDQSYSASSTNAQSGTAVADALSNVNQVPSSTSADETKVLTVNSSGEPVWANAPTELPASLGTAGQVLTVNSGATGVEWAAAQGGGNEVPSVTSNDDGKILKASYSGGTGSYSWQDDAKKPVVAGTGISITNNTNDVTIAATTPVPAVTSSDDGKVLKASYSGGTGSYAWGSDDNTTYTAGNMIAIDSNNNNAIGVSTTAGITDIQQVAALPANPVSTVLYLIPET